MKSTKLVKKCFLAIGLTTLLISCSNEDHQEIDTTLSELQAIGKDGLEEDLPQ